MIIINSCDCGMNPSMPPCISDMSYSRKLKYFVKFQYPFPNVHYRFIVHWEKGINIISHFEIASQLRQNELEIL